MEDDDALALALLILCKKQRKSRSIWCRNWLLKRKSYSHVNLLNELKFAPKDWHNYLRMDEKTYLHLLSLVTPLIQKINTMMRDTISPHERLSATLRFLATGRSYECLKFSTIISKQALSRIIPETCDALYKVLQKDYLKLIYIALLSSNLLHNRRKIDLLDHSHQTNRSDESGLLPKTQDEWKAIAKEFHERWNFPHCLGAIDGKHVEIVPPPNSGSYYFNYKNRHSMVLLAIVDAKYKLLLFDFGTNGRVSDGGVFLNTKFYEKLEKGMLNIPQEETLSNNSRMLPYVFVADDAFALRKDMMKPFRHNNLDSRAKKIYNYRISRARRIVENVFGILAARFRIYRTQINLSIENIESVVRATCVLHNYLMTSCSSYASPDSFDKENFEEGTISSGLMPARSTLEPLQRTLQGNTQRTAKEIRNEFMSYFVNEGRVPWQDNFIH